jgi:polysaccharide pyruvyl transferase WcaK-like protein
MAEILLLGAFGQRNVGDDALCLALSDALPDHRLVIASSDPDHTARVCGRTSIPAGARSVWRAIRDADAIVIGGGTIFKPLHPSSGRRLSALLVNTLAVLVAARLRRVPIAFVGVGAAELHGAWMRRLAGRIATRADLLVLRDEESAAVLTDAGVPAPFWVGADLAWLLFDRWSPPASTRPADRRQHGRPRVTVAVSHFAGDRAAERTLATALERLATSGWQVRLQPWQAGRDDLCVAERIRAAVPQAVIADVPTDLATAAADFGDDELVIAMRFHALVAAAAAGRRVVAIAHEPKLAGLARRLDQIAVPPSATSSVVDSAFDWALAHDPATPAAVTRQIELAHQTVDLLRVLVDPQHVERPEDIPALQLSDGEGRW